MMAMLTTDSRSALSMTKDATNKAAPPAIAGVDRCFLPYSQ